MEHSLSSVSRGTEVAVAEIATAIDKSKETEKHNNLAVPEGEAGSFELAPSHVVVSMSRKNSVPGDVKQRRIHRVPQEMRLNKNWSQHLFYPVVVSVGPYHHGEPHLNPAEKLKDNLLRMFLSDSGQEKGLFYDPIMERIDEIRGYYVGVSKDDYDDAVLAEMMLRDGVFTIYNLLDDIEYLDYHLGCARIAFMYQDLYKVENQIPYSVIKLLLQLRFGKNEGEAIVRNYINSVCSCGEMQRRMPWEDDGEEPLHLAEANRMFLLQEDENRSFPRKCCPRYRWPARHEESSGCSLERIGNPFRSVTDLASKGIHFKPSSKCLTDISFSSYAHHGVLHLPIWFVTNNSKVFFSNLVAFELLPESRTDLAITSYIEFMKPLIESTKDVKKLREKGILDSIMGSDEEVVELFKNIDTMASGDTDLIFGQVNGRIEKHCRSRSKTWMADLLHTYFESPWTAIGLLAAAFLLLLTFSQTYLALLSYQPHVHKKQ